MISEPSFAIPLPIPFLSLPIFSTLLDMPPKMPPNYFAARFIVFLLALIGVRHSEYFEGDFFGGG